MQPLVDGMEMIKELNMKPGKEIGILIECLIEEQICNLQMTKEFAIEFLKIKRDEINQNRSKYGLYDNNKENTNVSGKKKQKNKK